MPQRAPISPQWRMNWRCSGEMACLSDISVMTEITDRASRVVKGKRRGPDDLRASFPELLGLLAGGHGELAVFNRDVEPEFRVGARGHAVGRGALEHERHLHAAGVAVILE